MIKITWVPNTDVDIARYEVWKSPDNLVFVKIADIIHNLSNPAVFDTVSGRFYYNDPTGLTSSWYKVRAVDSVGNFSAFTISKEASPPLPPTCVVFGTILDANGAPDSDTQIQVTVKSTEKDQSGQFAGTNGITSDQMETFTDDDGQWEIELIRNSIVVICIPKINLTAEVTVPNQPSAEITTLL